MRDAKTLKQVKPKVKYLVLHPGPNRVMRRRLKAMQIIRYRKHETWVRSLVRAGVDVEKVLAEKERKQQERMQEMLSRVTNEGGADDTGPAPRGD